MNTSPYYKFIADEYRTAQITLYVRFWDKQEQYIKEEFLGFVEASFTTANVLATEFVSSLKFGIPIANMRGYAYDGAANMAGKTGRYKPG